MTTAIAKFRRWLESVKATSPDCRGDDVSIVVVLADAPPEHRLCALGGKIHCAHGANNCCWCQFRREAMN